MKNLDSRLFLVSLAWAFWLIARPFQGIWHDGRFYALQALQHLNPASFSRDLFFLYGSQDQYSLFGPLYAAAISLWGLSQGTMVLQGLGLVLWFLAAWALARVLPGKVAVLALLLIATLDGHYGSHGVFSYGESFLTARLYAEALSLAGLAAWLSGRNALGGGVFAAAFMMHPLMALPAMMIGLGVLLRPALWFGLAGIGVVLALILGVAGVPPFTGLIHPMDADWFESAVARSPFVFLHAWQWEGFSQAIFVAVVAGVAWRGLADARLKRLAWVTLVCVSGAFAMAYLGGSLLKLPLIAALQLTRVMWIGLVITLILIAAMLWESRQGNTWDRMLVWGLALVAFLDAGTQGGHAVLVLAVFWMAKRTWPDYRPPEWFWPRMGLTLVLILLLSGVYMWTYLDWGLLLDGSNSAWRVHLSLSSTLLPLLAGAYWLLERDRLSIPWLWFGHTLAAGWVALAVMTWNEQRPHLNYDSPERQAAIAPIVERVPIDATVYWVEEVEKAWFWLGRANYVSFSQSAGSVFSPGTALEAQRRATHVRPLSQRDANQAWDKRFSSLSTGIVPLSALQQVCSDPVLDFVITKSRPEDGGLYFKAPHAGRGYALHDCRAMRITGLSEPWINVEVLDE